MSDWGFGKLVMRLSLEPLFLSANLRRSRAPWAAAFFRVLPAALSPWPFQNGPGKYGAGLGMSVFGGKAD